MDPIVSFTDSRLSWLNNPTEWNVAAESDIAEGELEGTGGSFVIAADGSSLTLYAPAKKDFWSKTFYNPILIKSDASALLGEIPVQLEVTVKVDFEFSPVSQFDQAGLLVYIDHDHWMKCGIEYCDGLPRLSVVVCNVFSDWSTQPWNATSISLKVHKVNQSDSLVVEAAPVGSSNDNFHFIRIAHLSNRSTENNGSADAALPWMVGPYAACPIQQKGCKVLFTNFSIGPREASMHSSEL